MSTVDPNMQLHQIAAELKADPSRIVAVRDKKLVTIAEKTLSEKEAIDTVYAFYNLAKTATISRRSDARTLEEIQSIADNLLMRNKELGGDLFYTINELIKVKAAHSQGLTISEYELLTWLDKSKEYPDHILAYRGGVSLTPVPSEEITEEDLAFTVNVFNEDVQKMLSETHQPHSESIEAIRTVTWQLLNHPIAKNSAEILKQLRNLMAMVYLCVDGSQAGEVPKLIVPSLKLIENSEMLQHLRDSAASIDHKGDAISKSPELYEAIQLCNNITSIEDIPDDVEYVMRAAKYLVNQEIIDLCVAYIKQNAVDMLMKYPNNQEILAICEPCIEAIAKKELGRPAPLSKICVIQHAAQLFGLNELLTMCEDRISYILNYKITDIKPIRQLEDSGIKLKNLLVHALDPRALSLLPNTLSELESVQLLNITKQNTMIAELAKLPNLQRVFLEESIQTIDNLGIKAAKDLINTITAFLDGLPNLRTLTIGYYMAKGNEAELATLRERFPNVDIRVAPIDVTFRIFDLIHRGHLWL